MEQSLKFELFLSSIPDVEASLEGIFAQSDRICDTKVVIFPLGFDITNHFI